MAANQTEFRVLLLGPFALLRNGQTVDTSRWQRRVETLFKLLVIAPEHRRLRDELIEILWPEAAPDAGAGNLRLLTHRLRAVLSEDAPDDAPTCVLTERGWVVLNPSYGWTVDLREFEHAAQSADRVETLEAAAALYRGEPLVEDRYEEWAIPIRESIGRVWRELCLHLGESLQRTGEHDSAAGWFERALESDPLDEEALRGLLTALANAGRRPDALRRFGVFERRLEREMGVSPTPETGAIVESIRAHVAAAADPAVAQVPNHQTFSPNAPPKGPRSRRSLWLSGGLLAALLLVGGPIAAVIVHPWTHSSATPTLVAMVDPHGSGPGQFHGPTGMGIDAAGNIYVADFGNGRIQKFSRGGSWLMSVGSTGRGTLQFTDPTDVAVDAQGDIYVADGGNKRVEKLSASGLPLDDFKFPSSSIAVDRRENVYSTDFNNNHIRKISPDGALLAKWGTGGVLPGRFQNPAGVAVDARGNIWVTDYNNDRVQELSPTGVPLGAYGGPGSGPEQFDNPSDVAVDKAGNVYIADTGNSRVQELSPQGRFIRIFGGLGDAPGKFRKPSGVAVDGHGDLYVSDYYHDRVQKLSAQGVPLWQTNGLAALPARH